MVFIVAVNRDDETQLGVSDDCKSTRVFLTLSFEGHAWDDTSSH